MNVMDATMIAEGVIEVRTIEEYMEAWGLLIKTGTAWRLQGYFGRTAQHMINQGMFTIIGEPVWENIHEALEHNEQ